MIRSFKELEERALSSKAKRVALAMAQEADALNAISAAARKNIVTPVLVGDEAAIKKTAADNNIDIEGFEIVHVEGELASASKAVELIREGEADVLMKGKVATATIMRAVLNKEKGLRGSGVISHITVMEMPSYHKLLVVTDAAVNIAPDLKTKAAMLDNAVIVANKLGVETPKAGVIGAVEKVNPEAMPATADAAILSKMSDRGQIKGCIVDGPFALDNAISKKSCEVKGIRTDVGGDADILLMPDIEAANVMYKTVAYLTDFKMAGIILGAKAPIILTSRSDSDEIKYLSILTGASLV